MPCLQSDPIDTAEVYGPFTGEELAREKAVFKNTKYKRMPRTVPLTLAAMALLTSQLEDITINLLDQFATSEWIFPTIDQPGGGAHTHPLHRHPPGHEER